jgi:ABC-type antimicrobial peptide transport system permease subunit
VPGLAIVTGSCISKWRFWPRPVRRPGLSVALAMGRVADSLLFVPSGHEPKIYIVSIGVLALFVAISGWIPARNVSRIAPMQTLRED